MDTIVVALPVYNEEKGLPKLLEKLIQLESIYHHHFHIVVVNDGSSDMTKEILDQYTKQYHYITCLEHRNNKGLGEAMKTLFAHVLQVYKDRDIVVTLDADNTHNPKTIPPLVAKLQQEDLDVVIASRFIHGGQEVGLSLMRKIYSRGARSFFKIFFPIQGVNDYSSGFRAYRIGYLRKAVQMYDGHLITSSGFECMVEILARFSKLGIKAGEYPLVLEYNLKETPSKMKVVKTIKGYFKLLKKVKDPRKLMPKEARSYE